MTEPHLAAPRGRLTGVTARILLVEDDASVREAVTFVLERAGFAVSSVSDGADAVTSLSSGQEYDLVVLDLMLPSLSGFDVCREVRKTSGMPIVMLTARADISDVVAGLELGADDYVTKPFEPAELAARIRAVLRRSSGEPEPANEMRCRDIVVDETAFRAFRDSNAVFCSCSGPRLPDELVRTADDVYVRFHGTKQWYRHDYSKEELAVWVRQIADSGAKRVWAYFNNDRNGYAIKNARELLRQLKRL